MKKVNLVGFSLMLVLLSIVFSSCGAIGVDMVRSRINVQGTPNTDIYLRPTKKYSHDSDKMDYEYAGSIDSLGKGILELYNFEYDLSYSRIIAFNSGYEPAEFKLKKRFNPQVLLDIPIFPFALLAGDPITLLSERKINTIELTQKSTVSCFEYYDKALSCQDNKEKIYYFHKAIEQDYRNEYGIKVYALDNIGSIYTDLGQPSKGIAYFKEALKIDPNCGAEKNLAYAQDIKQAIEEEQRRRYAEKEEKWNRTIATLNAVGSGLSAAGNALEQSSSTTTNYSSSNSTASTQKNSQSKNSNDNNNTLSANLNCKNIQNAYYGQIDNIRKIQNDWLDHSAHDAKNNTNLIGKDRQILRDVLKGIADIKKSISGKDCSIQINYELEEWARAHAN